MSGDFHTGQRLSYDDHLCSVRYIGEVRGTKGQWLGIEWDDSTRGKHDGKYNGRRYFTCLSAAPYAASFIRPNRPADKPRSFVQALRFKYASEPQEISVESNDELVDYQEERLADDKAIKISGKEVEEVGFDKIRKRLADLHELRVVILDGLCMRRPVEETDRRAWGAWSLDGAQENDPLTFQGRVLGPRDACPQVMELDVSRNLFEEWLEVASVCEELPDMRSLRCDGNRFRSVAIDDHVRQYFTIKFRKVDSLSLATTLLPWDDLGSIAQTFSNITNFVASENQLEKLSPNVLPTTLRTITLEGNQFKSLSDVSALCSLPNLRKLVLRNNEISSIAPADSPAPRVFQPSLHDLDLSRNAISAWSFIDALDATLPGLTALRISGNPLYDDVRSPDGRFLSADDGYTLTVARLPRVAALNRSAVAAKDRLNAETYYLSHIALEAALQPAGVPVDTVTRRHPRWRALCDEYGEPVIAKRGSGAAESGPLSAQLMRLRLTLGAGVVGKVDEGLVAGGQEPESLAIRVPKRYSIYAVQGLVGRRLGLPPPDIRLVWETGEPDVVAVREKTSGEPWDSDVEDEPRDEADNNLAIKMREVELAAGPRAISTWVEGDDVLLRVELR